MTKWLIETSSKKNAYTFDTWARNGVQLTLTTMYRWGKFYTQSEKATTISNDSEINVTNIFPDYEIEDLEDIISEDWNFDELDISDDEQEAIAEGWDEDGYEYMQQTGWNYINLTVIFHGPFNISKVE